MSNYLDKIAVGSITYDIKDSNAYVLPSTGIPSSDLAAGVIPIVPTAYDTAAQALGTASAGASPSWARGDHIHPMPSASDVGAVPAPASASSDNVLAYNGSAWVADKRMVILSYGHSTWAEFLSAYRANAVIYCRASSNSNPGSGSQTRMAFMAYVNNADNPTNVEFQYYRSVNSHSVTQQGDQVYVYKLDRSAGWTVTVRESYTKINVSTGLASSYNNGALTITNPAAVPTGGTTGQALVKTSSSNYALAWQTIDVGHSIPSGGLNGQVLAKSSNDDYAVAWTTAGGGTLVVNITRSGSTFSSDTSPSQIYEAFLDGKQIYAKYENGIYQLSSCSNTNSYFVSCNVVSNAIGCTTIYIYSSSGNTRVSLLSGNVSTLKHYTFYFSYDSSQNTYTYNGCSEGDEGPFFWENPDSIGNACLVVSYNNASNDPVNETAWVQKQEYAYETIDGDMLPIARVHFANLSVSTMTITDYEMVWNLNNTFMELNVTKIPLGGSISG